MAHIQFKSPVEFPVGWERTPLGAAVIDQKFAPTISIEEALRDLKAELESLYVESATVYSNYDYLENEYKRSKRGNSEGASVKLKLGKTTAFIACDKWHKIAQNLYSLQLAIRYFRMYEEWGIATAEYMLSVFEQKEKRRLEEFQTRPKMNGEFVERRFVPEWMNILGLGPTATIHDANAVYRQRAKQVATDEAELIKLNTAIEQAREALT